MKAIVYLVLIFFLTIRALSAQDKFVFNSGKEITVKINRETTDEFYFSFTTDTLAVLKVLKTDLSKVVFANGEVRQFEKKINFQQKVEKITRFDGRFKRRIYHVKVKGDFKNYNGVRRGLLSDVTDSSIVLLAANKGNDYYNKNRVQENFNIQNIDIIKIRRRNSVGRGLLTGVLIGFVGGGIISGAFIDYGIFNSLPPEENAIIGGTLFSIPGLVFGGLIGSSSLKFPIRKKSDRFKSQKHLIERYEYVNYSR